MFLQEGVGCADRLLALAVKAAAAGKRPAGGILRRWPAYSAAFAPGSNAWTRNSPWISGTGFVLGFGKFDRFALSLWREDRKRLTKNATGVVSCGRRLYVMGQTVWGVPGLGEIGCRPSGANSPATLMLYENARRRKISPAPL